MPLVGLQAAIGLVARGQRHTAMHPAQVSPLHALLGTGHCGSAHISGRSGANSCPGNSPSPLCGTRWDRDAGSQAKQQAPSFTLPQPRPSRPKCHAPHMWKGGLGPHHSQLLACSGNPAARTSPIFYPSSAQASPKKTGCWQRGQVQLMVPLRAAGAAHSRHRPGRGQGDSFPAPSAGSAHGSALDLIGLNSLLLDAHWPPEILLHLEDGRLRNYFQTLKPRTDGEAAGY